MFLLGTWAPALTATSIGYTYDEFVYAGEASRVAAWFREIAADLRTGRGLEWASREVVDTYWSSKDMQPSLVKLMSVASVPVFSHVVAAFAAARSASFLFFGLTLTLTFLLGRELAGRSAGLSAALGLLFMPRVFGHAHLVALDTAVSSMVLASTYSAWKLLEKGTWWRVVCLGLTFGLALNAKINALLVVPVVCIWWAGELALCVRRREEPGSMAAKSVEESASPVVMTAGSRNAWPKLLLALFVVGPLVFVATWPWLWHDTVRHAVGYFRFHFTHYPVAVTYFGRNYSYAPWHYPFVMTGITTPPSLLVMGVAGLVGAVMRWRKTNPAHRLVFLSAVGQVALFALPHTPKYNGVRLFLPAFPFLSLLGGVAFAAMVQRLCSWVKRLEAARPLAGSSRMAALVLGAVLLMPGLYSVLDTHPFELSYYNGLIGGLPGAVRRGFEPTYWGDTYLQGLDFLNEKAPPGGVVHVWPVGVDSYLRFYQNIGALRQDLVITSDDRKLRSADFVIFHTRQSEMGTMAKRLLQFQRPAFAVKLHGVPLLVIYDREEVAEALDTPRP